MYDVAIIGGGAGGMSTALYSKRAGLNPIIIERGVMGGQINNTETIENYIGVGNITGKKLSEDMKYQIIDNNIDIEYMNVKSIARSSDGIFKLSSRKKEIFAKTIVLATGVKHKELGISGEKENQGNGVSYCAICDGYFFKGKNITVIGGGDSAFEEGAFLADIAKSVTLMYYKDMSSIKAKQDLVDKFMSKDNTIILTSIKVKEIKKDEEKLNTLCELNLKNKNKESSSESSYLYKIKTDGIFIYVGVEPINNLAVKLRLKLDKNGYIEVDNNLKTTKNGIYAVGDIIHPDIKQVAIAVSDGAIVSMSIKKYLETL